MPWSRLVANCFTRRRIGKLRRTNAGYQRMQDINVSRWRRDNADCHFGSNVSLAAYRPARGSICTVAVMPAASRTPSGT
jgi:hypothetical protein